jgi:hypothetical protein
VRDEELLSTSSIYGVQAIRGDARTKRTLSRVRGPGETATRPLAVAVTAFSVENALEIIRNRWYLEAPPVPISVEADIDLSAVPPAFGKAAVGPTNWRGVWYPFYELE